MKNRILLITVLFFAVFVFTKCKSSQQAVVDEAISETGKDTDSGLQLDKSMMLVKGQCTACHSAKLITMNRFTREGWKEKIEWMQKTQNLWDLGEAEPEILDYLAKYYSPEPQASRRENLKNVDWYELEEK